VADTRGDQRPDGGPGETGNEAGLADRMRAGYAGAEAKNEAVRQSLEPLAPGERPRVVTVGAIFSLVVALIFWVSAGVAAMGAEVNGQQPNVAQLVATALLMSIMFLGLWQAKYWAVLGFQMLLVLLILAGVLGIVATATTLVEIVATSLLVVGLSLMFWHMVRAMARIQMPERPSRDVR
jgi:hypothetical protein